MSRMNTYQTGLWVIRDSEFPKGPFIGKGWRLSFAKDRSPYPHIQNSSEVIVHAGTWKVAQQATNLIHASIILINGDSVMEFTDRKPFAYSADDDTIKQMPKNILDFAKGYSLFTPDIPLACKIATKASLYRHYCYALTKYYLSCRNYSTPFIDLDPFHSRNLRLSPFYDDHVLFATSIILAYSAIEEMDLHIKASEKKPSRLANGDWNPEVRDELKRRLELKGIDVSELFLWSLRGPKRRIDKKRPPRPHSRPRWSRGSIKDVDVDILDAVADASWLRSKVSAHGFSDLAPSLSPYDVANVQHLARRLILESLGFWRYPERQFRRRTHGN